MDQPESRSREAPISVRVPKAQREEFMARIASSSLSPNAYIVAAVLGQAAPPVRRSSGLDPKMAGVLLARTAGLADQLRTIAASNHDPRAVALVEQCRSELVEIRTCLMLALGRKP